MIGKLAVFIGGNVVESSLNKVSQLGVENAVKQKTQLTRFLGQKI
jgi:hypothetical protein